VPYPIAGVFASDAQSVQHPRRSFRAAYRQG
jgi:hypothetical protein